jgi:hypothetical protein
VIALDGGRTVLVQLGSGWAARSGQPAEFSPDRLPVPRVSMVTWALLWPEATAVSAGRRPAALAGRITEDDANIARADTAVIPQSAVFSN